MAGAMPSIFAGLSQEVLQANLTAAQQAFIELSTGARVVTASYTQGDGSRSVTYNQASIANLQMLIRQLQAELGIIDAPRRTIRPLF